MWPEEISHFQQWGTDEPLLLPGSLPARDISQNCQRFLSETFDEDNEIAQKLETEKKKQNN